MKKKIIFLNGHMNIGGVEKSLLDILRTINTDKYEVELLLFEEFGDYIDEIPKEIHVRLLDLHNTYGSLVRAITKCIKTHDWKCLWLKILFTLERIFGREILCLAKRVVFGKQRYDCAIGFRPGICMDMVAYAVSSKRKIGWWHHGSVEMNDKQLAEFAEICRKMDYIVSVSKGCKLMLENQIPELQDKIIVIPNMIDISQIQKKAEAYKPFERDEHRLKFVTVGRLSQEKHIENVIRVAKQLKESKVADFHWYIVGDGAERTFLEALIKDMELGNNVFLVGNKPNPYPYIKNADIYVHSSYVESQGLTILEAMTLGIPCVVTKSVGPKEFIEDGRNGILVEQAWEALYNGIVCSVLDEKVLEQVKNNTYCPIEFLPDIVIKKIETLIDEGEL